MTHTHVFYFATLIHILVTYVMSSACIYIVEFRQDEEETGVSKLFTGRLQLGLSFSESAIHTLTASVKSDLKSEENLRERLHPNQVRGYDHG